MSSAITCSSLIQFRSHHGRTNSKRLGHAAKTTQRSALQISKAMLNLVALSFQSKLETRNYLSDWRSKT